MRKTKTQKLPFRHGDVFQTPLGQATIMGLNGDLYRLRWEDRSTAVRLGNRIRQELAAENWTYLGNFSRSLIHEDLGYDS